MFYVGIHLSDFHNFLPYGEEGNVWKNYATGEKIILLSSATHNKETLNREKLRKVHMVATLVIHMTHIRDNIIVLPANCS
ncbi:hypothetical protein B7P43_G05743 [Cryptotermes secundus]|uniref:Uncharacterized protein n=1 Tax=Cryptotermes secundus TaxID=105785 RepID=A0A2J7QTY6_9NEOP|nr:hypothetical protein B7P43_G05743 [Cryptotermes secundus]